MYICIKVISEFAYLVKHGSFRKLHIVFPLQVHLEIQSGICTYVSLAKVSFPSFTFTDCY